MKFRFSSIIHSVKGFPKGFLFSKTSKLKLLKYFALTWGGGFFFFLLLDLLFPLRVQLDYSQMIMARDSTFLHGYLNASDKWRFKTELPEIIPALQKAIIYKEDKYFYYHPGINPISVIRASLLNLLYWKKTSGASTISMQVIRLLRPRARTYRNKLIEMFRALQLDLHYSKEEILQLYLNLIPYGGNIEGVKSAAWIYFERNPDKLSLAQIITLAIIPNRPTSLRLGEANDHIRKERNRWLRRLGKADVFPESQINSALEEPLEVSKKPTPRLAPHLSRRMHRDYPKVPILYTSIDLGTQQQVEQLSRRHVQSWAQQGIHNVSVLVLDNVTGEVRAYLGSSEFKDREHAGEVDGIEAIRSPGSTLKPLAYALAFDLGKLNPKTILADVPSDFQGFEPENFYKNFQGPISAERALIQSLNIPAVKVLERIGLEAFLKKLIRANFRQIETDQKKLGLSVILGGCGVSLEQLSNLYRSFSQEGRFTPLSFLPVSTPDSGVGLLSPSAAFVTAHMLSQGQRPDLPSGFENTHARSRIAWKTGTSFGRRDAWSIGFNTRYTIGVWLGNFSGESSSELVGAQTATPLLFELFNSLSPPSPQDWFAGPLALKQRWVCSKSGLPPDTFCREQVLDYYIPLVSSSHTCNHQKVYFVSEDESESYCMHCLPSQSFKKRLYDHFKPEIAVFYQAMGLDWNSPPPHHPQCTRPFETSGEPPLITSPSADREYLIDRDAPAQLLLSCRAGNDTKQIDWYIDDTFYQRVPVGEELFFTPEIGKHTISCTDDRGRTSHIDIRVLYQ